MLKYSVALCTYNGEKYIIEQLRSIIEQTIQPMQILISDDGSSDKTIELAQQFLSTAGIPFEIVKNKNTKGVTGNFCNAFSLCSEEIIFTSDQDDIWLNNKAETILSVFENNNDALLVFSDGLLVDDKLQPIGSNMWSSVGISKKMLIEKDWFSYLLNRCLVTGAAMAFKKSLIDEAEVIPQSWLHDGWLAWKAVAKNGLYACDRKLILYRQHGNNVVGMSSMTSFKRIKNYFLRFHAKDPNGRYIRYERYLALNNKMGHMFTKTQQKELKKCIHFWQELIGLEREKSRIKRIGIIMHNWTNGNFRKYASGSRGALRILILSLS